MIGQNGDAVLRVQQCSIGRTIDQAHLLATPVHYADVLTQQVPLHGQAMLPAEAVCQQFSLRIDLLENQPCRFSLQRSEDN